MGELSWDAYYGKIHKTTIICTTSKFLLVCYRMFYGLRVHFLCEKVLHFEQNFLKSKTCHFLKDG